MAAYTLLFWTRLPGERRLYGSRQLGHRPGRGQPVWLYAAVGVAHEQRNGFIAAVALGPSGYCAGARPGPGQPRNLSQIHQLPFVCPGRSGYCRHRPGRGAGHGHRHPAAHRPTLTLGRVHHRVRYVPVPAAAAPGHAQDGSFYHPAGCHHRDFFPRRDPYGQAQPGGGGTGPYPLHSQQPGPLYRHRYYWRHGHAPQPLPAFSPRADPEDPARCPGDPPRPQTEFPGQRLR